MNFDLFNHVVDAIDVETFILCRDEDEGKQIMFGFLKQIGFIDTDIVFIEFNGLGARIRARGYLYRPGDEYAWLSDQQGGTK